MRYLVEPFIIGTAEDPHGALVLAEECTGAVRGRWVNQGVVQGEYRDFVRAGCLISC
ncbi:hypothetical protein [Streptomyces sp. SID5643]|uniref:hypothetical protein n=1 Tax=Streptomyces sp. SID5643 TaxID=2690307 RepID=UPI0013FBD73B|nr:hypothetical protein [Streptomyces sp. SID5643]MZF85750.1 hypothetical protein [Streptomyces sp. SID5643]